ncbi:hypothetical protein Trco_008049 [Trichoderma cornu-damae]|uniref:Uncharacterized protein n=1 Tax=Trichoderma cornu-damae TaxID=654480 RepID=A0A9P8TSH9_9HYPO|nr:hypothetical protein Trco_008049 [Trichoderma cornu-damae]
MPNKPLVGYVEDVDEGMGSTIGVESTRRYARSEAPRSPERSNTGKPRGDRRIVSESDSEDDTASSGSSLSGSDSTPAPVGREKVRPVSVDHRRPSHKDREPRRDPRDPRDARGLRGPRDLTRDQRERERQRRERKPRDEEDHRRVRPGPKDRDSRDPRDPRDPRDLRDLREPREPRDPRGLKKTRPAPPKHAASQPVVSQGAYRRGQLENPAAYGVQQPAASGQRPRAKSRPSSYYGGQPPQPPLDMAWVGPHPPLPPPPPGAFAMSSFPPPPMFPPGGPPMHPGMPLPSPMGMGPPLFFDGPMGPPPPPGERLRHRFDGRPSSSMGFGSPPEAIGYLPDEYDDYEDEPSQRVARRPPRAKRAPPPPEERERRKMPPADFLPKRTQSARPTAGAFKPPQAAREPMREPPREHLREQARERPLSRPAQQRAPPSHRRSVGFVDQAFDEDDFSGEVDLYQEVPPNQRRTALTRTRRSSSVAYDQNGYDIVPAGNRGRRASLYGHGPHDSLGGVSLEEDNRYFDALRYQEDVSGGTPMPLTAESLRKASKRAELASSRSTKSSGSHDESDYKRSHTTGLTTQSSAPVGRSDDLTIKVSGQGVVKVPGAQIECDGGEITFSSSRGAGAGAGVGAGTGTGAGPGPGSGPPGASRAGSDKESTVYQLDDARSSRMDRKALPHRPRAASQSDVHSRIYAPLHAPYEHAPYEPFETYERITYEHAPYDPSLTAANFYY